MNDTTRDLLVHGIAAAKAGEVKEATFYLEWLLRLEPPLEERKDAWYWLSKVSPDPKIKRQYIEEILANDLWDSRARRELAILDGKLKPDAIIDPDRVIQPIPDGPQAAAGQRFTCPTCGGRMTFTPDGQSLTCEYCESRQSLRASTKTRSGAPAENEFIIGMSTTAGHFRPMTIHEITCKGCGATFLLNPEQLTRACPYCASAYVLDQPTMRETVAPDGLIPFKINENQARQILLGWSADQQFNNRPRVARGRGVYLPVWCFDVGGNLLIRCQIEKTQYGTKRHEWEDFTDQRVVLQQNILIRASRAIMDEFENLLGGYDLAAVVTFDERYLANWLAETYQIAMSDASLEARQRALNAEKGRITATFEYHYRDMRFSSANMLIESFQLLLLPVWISKYIDGNRQVPIWINGQTGAVMAGS